MAYTTSVASNSASSTSVAVSQPGGGWLTGNTLVALVTVAGTANLPTTPSGWSLVKSASQGSNLAMAVYSQTLSSGGPASFTFSGSSYTTAISAVILEYSGTYITSGSVDNSSANTGSSTTPSWTANNTTFGNEVVLLALGTYNATLTGPWSSGYSLAAFNTSTLACGYFADSRWQNAGSTGSPATTISAVSSWGAIQVALIPIQVVVTSGSSWTIPAVWNNGNNTIQCWGGGQTPSGSTGGAGGDFSSITNFSGSGSVSIQIGGAGGDTWFNSTSTVLAPGGGSNTTQIGTIKYSGGAGASNGGGGAAGPNGNGQAASGNTGGGGDGGLGGAGGTGSSQAFGTANDGTSNQLGGGGGGGASGNFGSSGDGGAPGGGGGGKPTLGSSGNGAHGQLIITYGPQVGAVYNQLTSISANGAVTIVNTRSRLIASLLNEVFYIQNAITWSRHVQHPQIASTLKMAAKAVGLSSAQAVINLPSRLLVRTYAILNAEVLHCVKLVAHTLALVSSEAARSIQPKRKLLSFAAVSTASSSVVKTAFKLVHSASSSAISYVRALGKGTSILHAASVVVKPVKHLLRSISAASAALVHNVNNTVPFTEPLLLGVASASNITMQLLHNYYKHLAIAVSQNSIINSVKTLSKHTSVLTTGIAYLTSIQRPIALALFNNMQWKAVKSVQTHLSIVSASVLSMLLFHTRWLLFSVTVPLTEAASVVKSISKRMGVTSGGLVLLAPRIVGTPLLLIANGQSYKLVRNTAKNLPVVSSELVAVFLARYRYLVEQFAVASGEVIGIVKMIGKRTLAASGASVTLIPPTVLRLLAMTSAQTVSVIKKALKPITTQLSNFMQIQFQRYRYNTEIISLYQNQISTAVKGFFNRGLLGNNQHASLLQTVFRSSIVQVINGEVARLLRSAVKLLHISTNTIVADVKNVNKPIRTLATTVINATKYIHKTIQILSAQTLFAAVGRLAATSIFHVSNSNNAVLSGMTRGRHLLVASAQNAAVSTIHFMFEAAKRAALWGLVRTQKVLGISRTTPTRGFPSENEPD